MTSTDKLRDRTKVRGAGVGMTETLLCGSSQPYMHSSCVWRGGGDVNDKHTRWEGQGVTRGGGHDKLHPALCCWPASTLFN